MVSSVLEYSFSTSDSYIFDIRDNKCGGQIHIHLGKYIMNITMILLNKEECEPEDYISRIFLDLDVLLGSSIMGFLVTKNKECEFQLKVFHGNKEITYAPDSYACQSLGSYGEDICVKLREEE